MSTRSPLGSGASFIVPAFNPGDVQSHAYWGQYLYDAATAPNSIAGRAGSAGSKQLPNEQNNALGSPEFEKLRTGDIASTAFNSAISTGTAPSSLPEAEAQGLFVCVYPGTLSGGDAVWERLDEAVAVLQTIRDAHVIVVGQKSILSTLSSVAIPPLATNALNLSVGVGDVVGVTCDYLDDGDGLELTLALSAASVAGANVDIRLRPCAIDLDPAIVPLALPANTRLIGAGGINASSKITGTNGKSGSTQCVITLDSVSSLEDLVIFSPAPLTTPGGTEQGVIEMIGNGDASVLRCAVQLEASAAATLARIAVAAIRSVTPQGHALVSDCELVVESLAHQNVPGISYGVWFGRPSAGTPARTPFGQDSEVRNTTIHGPKVRGSAPRAVRFDNVEGGRCFNVEHDNAENAESFSWVWDRPLVLVAGAVPVRGCSFIECRVNTQAIAGQTPGDTASQTGFTIEVGAGAVTTAGWSDFKIHDCEVTFQGVAAAGFVRTGYLLKNSISVSDGPSPDDTQLANVTFDNCKAYASRKGFHIDGLGVITDDTAPIKSVKLTACQARDMVAVGSVSAEGLLVAGGVNGAENVFNVGVVNCDFSGTPSGATNSGIKVLNSQAWDTLIGFNSLTPLGTGVALSDSGSGTEAAHNVLA